jgi:hypothetical protein
MTAMLFMEVDVTENSSGSEKSATFLFLGGVRCGVMRRMQSSREQVGQQLG